MTVRLSIIAAPLMILALLAGATPADAQMDNRPFQFRNGPGLSLAGRQAILDKELLGRVPDTIGRGPFGSLVIVRETEGGAAIAFDRAGVPVVGGLTGSGWRDSRTAAGIFNPFFLPSRNGTTVRLSTLTTAPMDAWLTQVNLPGSGYPRPATRASSIDTWTSLVHAAY